MAVCTRRAAPARRSPRARPEHARTMRRAWACPPHPTHPPRDARPPETAPLHAIQHVHAHVAQTAHAHCKSWLGGPGSQPAYGQMGRSTWAPLLGLRGPGRTGSNNEQGGARRLHTHKSHSLDTNITTRCFSTPYVSTNLQLENSTSVKPLPASRPWAGRRGPR